MERNYFANNLKVLRKAKGLKLKDIADKLGVSTTLIHYWENDERYPVLDDVRVVAEMLNISIADLVGRDITQTYSDNLQTEMERELLYCFRTLTSDQQSAVLTMVKGMAKV